MKKWISIFDISDQDLIFFWDTHYSHMLQGLDPRERVTFNGTNIQKIILSDLITENLKESHSSKGSGWQTGAAFLGVTVM